MATYGRNRQSIADIELELHDIFDQHPLSHTNSAGEPVIPADALVDIFRAFSDIYNGVELMTSDEMDMLKSLLATNPGLEVTPQILLQFIAEKTKHSPRTNQMGSDEDDTSETARGRLDEREIHNHHSRSSSNDSATASFARIPSRPSSRGPQTPSNKGSSPFDITSRQRTTPLSSKAPSSWSKPTAAHRRKSDAGSRSDSESYSTSPNSFGRVYSRSRVPSNPTSPTMKPLVHSPSAYTASRPASRNQFYSPHQFKNGVHHDFSSPPRMRSPASDLEDDLGIGESFINAVSSLPMPRSPGDDDSDVEDTSFGLVMDRSTASSTVSLEPDDRLDVLQRANTELSKKLMEAEKTLQNRLEEHELELEEMQSRLDEVRSELSATKREEKELRSKERQNSTQIAALESEVGKLQKSLENARATYSSLQKQYQEQCAESERYRNTLRRRDQEIKDYQESAALQSIENQKYIKERDRYEDRIVQLEADLAMAHQAQMQLDEQKQENLMLKETIDRMRFDMDELRSSAVSTAAGGPSGFNSAVNTISKSLGAELLAEMKTQWGTEDEITHEGEDDRVLNADDNPTGGNTEGEDVIQTIIMRKRKVASRAKGIEMRRFEELKEYSDAYTQHEASDFVTSRTIQTDSEPKVITRSFCVQTEDPEPIPGPVSTASTSTAIRTENAGIHRSRSPSPVDGSLASSSSTVLPPTPKEHDLDHLHLHIHDLPPSYHQVSVQDKDDRDWRIAAETLKKWHKGAKIPFEPAANPLSDDALEEWQSLKEELGIDCMVIDKVISTSERTGAPRAGTRESRHTHGTPPSPSTKDRFYNIYNTYVYGTKDGLASFPTHFALGVGATALLFLAMSPYMVPHYSIPGGPTYYDRAAWNSFNTMQAVGEGFSTDGTAAVWNFLGRVSGGAARIARGWPT